MTSEITERLLKNYYNARKSWEGWCYLNNIALKVQKCDVRKYVDENELLFYLRYLLSKDMHIELYKIIRNSKNTTDNIYKLLRNLNTVEAISYLKKLDSFEIKIKSLNDLRDKFYAHLDADYKDFITNFKVDDYYKIFELIEEAIIILGKKSELLAILETIPSRDEFEIRL